MAGHRERTLSECAAIPLAGLDPAAPPELGWLDDIVDGAGVVAIGESAHYTSESYRFRHLILRHLVQQHGFSACVMETGFVEGWMVDSWVRGDDSRSLDEVMATGFTSLMGMWSEMRDQLAWMREHNRRADHPVGFHGLDLPGSNTSLLPGLDAVIEFLSHADPDHPIDPEIRSTATHFAAASSFSAPDALGAYAGLTGAQRNALTAGLAELAVRLRARRLEHIRRTSTEAHDRAAHALDVTIALDAMIRELTRGGPSSMHSSIRDAAMADTVEQILRGEHRIVVAAHNAHVQRAPVSVPGILPSSTTLGMYLADRLGAQYRVIGTTTGPGRTLNSGADFFAGQLFTDLDDPGPGTVDALMAASHPGCFAVDLTRLDAADRATVRAASLQQMGPFRYEIDAGAAYDVLVHLPQVHEAHRDRGALAHAPDEVSAAFR